MKWTDHPDTMLQSFSSLYTDESYTDVTLVAEGNFFKAHRCILSSASEFFDETFKMTPSGQHPLIFLKDVKSLHLRILLDFIYKGEVSIPQVAIPALVKIGKDLRVRGLSDFIWNEQLVTQNATFQDATPIHTSNNPTGNWLDADFQYSPTMKIGLIIRFLSLQITVCGQHNKFCSHLHSWRKRTLPHKLLQHYHHLSYPVRCPDWWVLLARYFTQFSKC